jgi:hypothetical protein
LEGWGRACAAAFAIGGDLGIRIVVAGYEVRFETDLQFREEDESYEDRGVEGAT